MSDLNEVLADVEKEGDNDPFAALEKETPSESPTENEPEEEEAPEVGAEDNAPEEENLPFHKHPRWIERERELAELRDRDAAREAEFAELRELATRKPDETDTEVPESFQRLYGNDPVAYKAWREEQSRLRDETTREVIETLRREQEEAVQESQKWNNWVEENIQSLSESGKQFDRNELIKTMLEYKPTDEEGNFDFEAGFRIYEALNKKEDTSAKSQARRALADTTTRSTNSEAKKKDYMTPAELRNKSWSAL